MTETQTYLCKNCNITSTVEVKYDRNLEDKQVNEIRELKRKVKEHNQNIKTRLFGLYKSDKEWELSITRDGLIGIKEKDFPLFKDISEMIHVEIGYNYIECPSCKVRHYFKKPGEMKKERLN